MGIFCLQPISFFVYIWKFNGIFTGVLSVILLYQWIYLLVSNNSKKIVSMHKGQYLWTQSIYFGQTWWNTDETGRDTGWFCVLWRPSGDYLSVAYAMKDVLFITTELTYRGNRFTERKITFKNQISFDIFNCTYFKIFQIFI